MDNTRYYVDSLAYDFDMFLPKEKKKDNIYDINSVRKNVRNEKDKNAVAVRHAIRSRIGIIATVAFLLGVICFNIYLRVEITETSSQISKMETTINKAKSEQTQLEMDVERITNYTNIEEAAAKLGMQKAEKYQVTYITVTNGDKAETVDDGEILTAKR